MTEAEDTTQVPEIDTSTSHPARIYDWLLGGKDNYAADREVGQRIVKAFPGTPATARENRAFLGRAVRYLAKEAGIRQFLDIGTGIPTVNAVHEVAQSIAPESRVVYADNDPIVLAHARALLRSAPQGVTNYVHADIREADAIVEKARATLDFSQPIALMLVAILHFVPDEWGPADLVGKLVEALPLGSYLCLTAGSFDPAPTELAEFQRAYNSGAAKIYLRSVDQIDSWFAGLSIVEPGIVPVQDWRPSSGGPRPSAKEVPMFGGVARKVDIV
jgi:hypothetical protein